MKIEVDNKKLNKVCNEYGLDASKALYYSNVVVIPGSKDNLYVTLDKDCNVIDVRDYENGQGNMYNYFEGVYSIFNDDIITGILLNDEYGSLDSLLSFGTIIKLTDKYSSDFNGKMDENFNEDQKNLISYLAFLRHIMNRFLLLSYQMKSYRYVYPDLEDYIKTVIDDLNKFVDGCLSFNVNPDEYAFIDMSGQKSTFCKYSDLLNDTIKLLTKCRGYEKDESNDITVIPISIDDVVSMSDLVSEMKGSIEVQKTDQPVLKKRRRRRKNK